MFPHLMKPLNRIIDTDTELHHGRSQWVPAITQDDTYLIIKPKIPPAKKVAATMAQENGN